MVGSGDELHLRRKGQSVRGTNGATDLERAEGIVGRDLDVDCDTEASVRAQEARRADDGLTLEGPAFVDAARRSGEAPSELGEVVAERLRPHELGRRSVGPGERTSTMIPVLDASFWQSAISFMSRFCLAAAMSVIGSGRRGAGEPGRSGDSR